MGNSPRHARSISLVLHLDTAHVSPQFHVAHDEFFETVERNGSPKSWRIVADFHDSNKIQQPKRSSLRKILWKDQAPTNNSPRMSENSDEQETAEANQDEIWTPSTQDEGNEDGEVNNEYNGTTSPLRRSTRTRIPTRAFLQSVEQEELEFPLISVVKNMCRKPVPSMLFQRQHLQLITKLCIEKTIVSKIR